MQQFEITKERERRERNVQKLTGKKAVHEAVVCSWLKKTATHYTSDMIMVEMFSAIFHNNIRYIAKARSRFVTTGMYLYGKFTLSYGLRVSVGLCCVCIYLWRQKCTICIFAIRLAGLRLFGHLQIQSIFISFLHWLNSFKWLSYVAININVACVTYRRSYYLCLSTPLMWN